MGKRYTRKALRQPDKFVSTWEKIYEAARPYARAILIALGSTFVVIAAGWGIDHFLASRREDATALFEQATKIAAADLVTDESPAKSEDKTPRFKSDKERMEAVIAELDKLDKGHASSEVAKRALLVRAGALYELGRYEDAQAAYQKFLTGARDNDPLRFLAREGIGLCAENRGKLDEALEAYRALEPKAGDFYRDRALYDQARVLTKKGDKKGAEAIYKDILAKVPQTPLRDEIQTRLGLLGATVPSGLAAPPGLGGLTFDTPPSGG